MFLPCTSTSVRLESLNTDFFLLLSTTVCLRKTAFWTEQKKTTKLSPYSVLKNKKQNSKFFIKL